MNSQSPTLRTNEQRPQNKPCFCYRVKRGAASYYYTNSDQNVTITGGPASKMANPQIFLKAQIKHDRPSQSADQSASGINISMAATDQNLRRYFLTCPTDEIEVEIFRLNTENLPISEDYANLFMEFKGVGSGVGFNDYTVTLNCSSLLLNEDRSIPRLYWQKTCQAVLYGRGCLLSRSLFSVSVAISAVDRIQKMITIPITSMSIDSPPRTHTFDDESFQGGKVIDSDANEIGIIVSKSHGSVTDLYLQWWPIGIEVADVVNVSLGCIRIPRICDGTFRNLANYRGMPYIPNNGNPAVDGIS